MLGFDNSAVIWLVLGVGVLCYEDNDDDGADITTIDVKKRFYFIKSHNFLEGLVK